MRKVIILALIATLLTAGLALPAGAGKKKPRRTTRVLKLPYTEPALGTAGLGLCFQGTSCVFFGGTAPKERFVSIDIKDDFGQPVYASVIQDTNEDGSYLVTDDLTVDICGKTTAPIELEPRKPVSVWIWQGPGLNPPCPGMASAGTVTATFSNLP